MCGACKSGDGADHVDIRFVGAAERPKRCEKQKEARWRRE